MFVAPVQSYARLPIHPNPLSLLDNDKATLISIYQICDHVLDRFSNHPYTAFVALFVNDHSIHLFVYGLYLPRGCLCILFTVAVALS